MPINYAPTKPVADASRATAPTEVDRWGDYADTIRDVDTRITGKAADADVVKLTGAQTIAGAKTFSTDPTLADGSSALSVTEGNAAYVKQAGGDTITASAATVKPLVVKGAASQTANLLEAHDSAGAELFAVNAGGALASAGSTPSSYLFGGSAAGENARLVAYAADKRVLVVRGAASQTANLAEFQDSAGTAMTKVDSLGRIVTGPTATALGQSTVVPRTDGTTGLVVRGVAGQLANLQEWQDSAGKVLLSVVAQGRLNIGPDLSTMLGITPIGASAVGLRVKGVASQTGNLAEFMDSAGTVLARIDAAGGGHFVLNGIHRRLEIGAVDSAGAGYRTVRVAN